MKIYSHTRLRSTPGIRTLEQIQIRGEIYVLRVEITDEHGDKTTSFEVHDGDCDFYENGLTEEEALASARGHTEHEFHDRT